MKARYKLRGELYGGGGGDEVSWVGKGKRDEFEDKRERGAYKRLDDLLSLYMNKAAASKRKTHKFRPHTSKGMKGGFE